MKTRIRLNPLADNDLMEIKASISEDSEAGAIMIMGEILARMESLADFPEQGSPLAPSIGQHSSNRYLLCERYLIFYTYENEIVSVQRVLHARRDYLTILFNDLTY